MTTLRIGSRTIQSSASCYVIAEVGVNHDGDTAVAHQLIDVAAAAGADAVKFQTFDVAQLVAQDAAVAPYQAATTGASDQRSLLERLMLPRSAWSELALHARERSIGFLSTAFDLASAELLVELGVPALKVPSGELNNVPFIRNLGSFGLPVLISTGMGTLDEVEAAVEAAGTAIGIGLFHCLSAYPAPVTEANLRAIPAMESRFGLPVGWSDHTQDSVTAVAAVALGASLLEKHVTLDRRRDGPDHAASSDPAGFRQYVAAVRSAQSALGDGRKRPMPSEEVNRMHARRSLHLARAVQQGDILRPGDVVALRPAVGLSPAIEVIGREMRRAAPAGTPILESDLCP